MQQPTDSTSPRSSSSQLHSIISMTIHALLYISVFLAGFIAAKLHTLLSTL